MKNKYVSAGSVENLSYFILNKYTRYSIRPPKRSIWYKVLSAAASRISGTPETGKTVSGASSHNFYLILDGRDEFLSVSGSDPA